jgi:predicted dehydrogenase
MQKHSRREFGKIAGLAAGAVFAPSLNALGANEEIRIGVCGVHKQGFANARAMQELDGVRVVALCDPDRAVLAQRVADFAERFDGAKVDAHIDYREMLDRKDIDAVVVATPNHWHALIGIYACQAGKDVYVQKPLAHCIWEGRQLVRAAEKYNRIVQTGTQNRSDTGLLEFYSYLAAGTLGKVKMARGICYKARASIGKSDTPIPPPETMDYNLWLGPAQDEPIYRPRYHYDWHWDFNTGNGDLGNQGVHELDLLRWALEDDKSLPTRVVNFGGRFVWNDAGNTPNMQYVAYEYNGVPVIFEARNMWLTPDVKAEPNFMGCRTGVVITCEDGYFVGGRGGGWVYDNDGKKVKQFVGDGGKGHFANFIQAMRSRKESDLRAPAIKGHLGACMAHQANISYRVGSKVSPDELRERMSGDKEATDAIERYGEQLASWNVDFKKEPWTAAISLEFDAKKERFMGTGELVDQANAMLRRSEYRKPFVVPEEVCK